MSQSTTTQNNNVSEEAGSGALNVKLHPLVIINISDHFTRAKIRNLASRVFGAMLGIQEGRNVEIFNSFEVVCTEVEGNLVFDMEYLQRKFEASTFLCSRLGLE
jgi:COP9 signalosome complex subunit 6